MNDIEGEVDGKNEENKNENEININENNLENQQKNKVKDNINNENINNDEFKEFEIINQNKNENENNNNRNDKNFVINQLLKQNDINLIKYENIKKNIYNKIIEKSEKRLNEIKLKLFEEIENSIPKIIINEIQKSINSSKCETIHKNIQCSKCGIPSIKGYRYKCPICYNYNLCEKCESEIEHKHDLLKIKKFIENNNPDLKEHLLNYSFTIDFKEPDKKYYIEDDKPIELELKIKNVESNWTNDTYLICNKKKSKLYFENYHLKKIKTNEEKNIKISLNSENEQIEDGEYTIFFSLQVQNKIYGEKDLKINIINSNTLLNKIKNNLNELGVNFCDEKILKKYLKNNNYDIAKTITDLYEDKKIK